ncbi:MAG: tetraacyldisaccharide 4'-kinase [Phycisphaeraceae bacterium]|nr:tetraacyldisaccharide 4'-kinase [Phycisphaeraceae bacterium]
MSLRQRALLAMSGEDHSLGGRCLRAALTAAVPAYALGNALRSAYFATGVKRTYALGRPTMSVGNLTTGGTGKTPMVGWVVERLLKQGHRPCILLRGYRGGDEAIEHQQRWGGSVRVEPNPDRVVAAKTALEDDPSITCFVLDDGFQHRRAQRDLDLVLIDATNPWGYGHLLPRGLMREPKSAIKRADHVVVTRSDLVPPEGLKQIDRQVETVTGKPPIAHAEHTWVGLVDAAGEVHDLTILNAMNVMGVVGIGNPAAFEATLTEHSGQVLHCEAQPDHHGYTRKQLLRFMDLATTAGAQAIVTTEKDWVKWASLLEDESVGVPIYRSALAMRFRDGGEELAGLLGRLIRARSASE